ncbi:MAG: HAD family hydrolase [Lachnospiraceae bacterium]|nr:HAD family hydrolase [Ruminococcus sp.]MCM1274691.1 HAD family hydrolase [Lachnospiraceae bacterium]
MDFGKVIFMTDLDGTLLTDDKRIIDRDLAAIERFRAGGGLFTTATGRGWAMARRIVEDVLHLDIPSVLFNGAGVYDFKFDRFLWQCEIGGHARGYIRRLNDMFPNRLGFEVLHKQTVFVPFINETEREHLETESVIPDRRALDEIPEGGWLKFVIAAPPEELDRVERAVAEGGFEDAQWVRSAPVYFECLPRGVDKSRGFAELIRILGAEDRFSVAAGDFMNDTAMIQKADLGAAVANAQPSVKAAADIVVCDNNSGAIAEIIDCIEKL